MLLPYLKSNSAYRNKKVLELKKIGASAKMDGVSLGYDHNGFFVYTGRCKSKSYKTVDDIPDESIKFVRSTG
jgi:hypothetical protein